MNDPTADPYRQPPADPYAGQGETMPVPQPPPPAPGYYPTSTPPGSPTAPMPPGTQYPAQPGYPQQGYQQPGYAPPGYGQPAVDPATGLPLSDKSKVVAGVLQLVLGGFGVGRFYTGHTSMAIAQIAVTWLTCGLGALWPLIDGILILVQPNQTDAQGRILRS
ncbi:TM2 domain-containing protein [Luedemannella helvata]|uniref:TM2 domain-containing protein n=1 Tax=Luedemannella helvata TaxID=349315 RepID=UPI0031E10E04